MTLSHFYVDHCYKCTVCVGSFGSVVLAPITLAYIDI